MSDDAGQAFSTDRLLQHPAMAATLIALSKVRTRDLVLPPQIHDAYLEHTRHTRTKINAGWMLWAAALNILCCALAFFIVPPGALEQVVVARIAISLVLALGAGAIFLARRSDVEGLLTIAVCLAVVALAGFMAEQARQHFAERYVVHAIFMCGTAIVISRIAWRDTVALTTSVMTALAILMATSPTADLSIAEKLQMAAFFGVGLIGLALAKRAMNKLQYRVFVLGLVDRLKMAEIEEMNGRLHAIARTDALTAVSNRRGFDEAYAALQGRPERGQCAVLMMDIDHFKGLNDTRGHAAGDECLRAVAGVISGELRHSRDLLARFGGEEFVAILPEVDGQQALSIAERIRAAVEARGVANPAAPGGVLTLSVGVAVSPPAAIERLVARADAALYEAKSGGRNAVRLAAPPAALRVA
ncbi:diguanylate cyclase [Chenggangzhangella methanolivorans]|uniref:GGDEF domain-containing protein n=1 Tax=Chenggangzhangella methanolivorans TaxID=1437009 RepID=UPI00361DC4BB